MSSWATLSRSLVQLETELRSSKQPIRCKAIQSLQSLLDTRSDELIQLIQGRHFTAETTWPSLVDSAHEACLQQSARLGQTTDSKGLAAVEYKTRDHVAVLQKLVALANRDRLNVPTKSILRKAFECFDDQTMVQNFGTCYLQLVHEHILQGAGEAESGRANNQSGLEGMRQADWNRLLTACVRMSDSERIQRLTLMQCLPPIIEHGCRYTFFGGDLVDFLPAVEYMIESRLEINALSELIRAIFLICSNLALDHRLTICQHLETILGHVIDAYSARMTELTKRTLFQLLHLAIAVHSPESNVCASSGSTFAANYSVWHLHLRNMFHLLQSEIRQQTSEHTRLQTNPRFNADFVAFGAALCAVMFWEPAVWLVEDAEGGTSEPTAKRQRRNDRLLGVIDAVETLPGKYCWRWMAVLAELLHMHPSSLEAGDFKPLLQMLHQFQLAIQYPVEVAILTRLAGFLLQAELRLTEASAGCIDSATCDDIWAKIGQTAFRTTAAALQQDNVELLRLLVVHKQCWPDAFLETVFRAFLSDAIRKSNAAVRLLIAIARHNSLDAIDTAEVKDMRQQTMSWLHRQKISLVNTERIEQALVAELTALCLFTKIDPMVVRRLDAADPMRSVERSEFTRFLDNLKHQLLYKSLRRLIVAEREANEGRPESVSAYCALPQANHLLAVINEQQFERLYEILNPNREIPEQPDSLIPFNAVTGTLILYLQLLDKLIAYSALDKISLEKTFLAKKCHLKIGQLEMCMANFSAHLADFGVKDTMDVLERLRQIFEAPLHPVLGAMMRSRELTNLVGWLRQWLGERPHDSRETFLRTLDQLNVTNQLRYESFAALAHLATGGNEQLAFAAIEEFDFNLSNNTDVLIVLRLLRIILQQTTSESKAEWCFNQVKSFVQLYYESQQLTEVIVNLLPDLVRFIRSYESMTDDLMQLVVSFLTLAKRRKYGPHITEKLIRSLISVASAYPDQLMSDDFAALYLVLSRFLSVNTPLRIQYATIATLSFVFDADWIRSNALAGGAPITLTKFHRSLYEALALPADPYGASMSAQADILTANACAEVDRSTRTICVRMQLFSAMIAAASAQLRHDAWFQMIVFCDQHELSADYMGAVLRQLCQVMRCSRADFVADNMRRLVADWLQAEYRLDRLPWFIDERASTLIEYCLLNLDHWAFNMLQWNPDVIRDFLPWAPGESTNSLILRVLPECLAYQLACLANCTDMPAKYTECALTIGDMLRCYEIDTKTAYRKQTLQIVKYLVSNTWDAKHFKKLFKFELDMEFDGHQVNYVNFGKCLTYIQQAQTNSSGGELLLHFCNFQPYDMFQLLQHTRMAINKSRYNDPQKLIALYQYATLLHYVVGFLVREPFASTLNKKTSMENVKLFFTRDLLHTLCNLMAEAIPTQKSQQFLLAILELVHITCTDLLPKCVPFIRGHFNLLVSTLLRLAAASCCPAPLDDDEANPVFTSTLRCLRFLIIEQQSALSAEIALLDNFPSNLPAFDDLRRAQTLIKYGGRKFSLCEELNSFLQIADRKCESLVTLREQLATKKSELASVFGRHEQLVALRAGGETTSSLHRLVLSLLKTVKSADGTAEISLEAAKCLGELGPSDLGTFVLQSDTQMYTYKFFATFDSATKHFCRVVLELLNDLLLHTNVEVAQAASESLLFLLEHTVAQDVADSYPHLSVFHSKTPSSGPVYVMPKVGDLKLEQIFAEHLGSEHNVWINAMVKELFDFFGDQTLHKLASIHTPFAECVLPLLVQMLLTCEVAGVLESLRLSVVGFFDTHQAHRDASNAANISSGRPLCLNWASIKAMVNVTECIRMYNLFNFERKIELNYLSVALAAQFCEAHFTAVLYADLWAMDQGFLNVATSRADNKLQTIMRDSYTAIGETDAVCAFLDPIANRYEYLKFNSAWSRIFLEQDVLSYAEVQHLSRTRDNLLAADLYGLSNCLAPNASTTSSAQYECAWRMGDWSLLDEESSSEKPTQTASAEHLFEQAHYKALHCLHIKDELGTKSAITAARRVVIDDLRSASLECTNNVYRHMQRLALVQQIEDFLPIQFQQESSSISLNIIDKWRDQDQIPASGFRCKEVLLAQRITILRAAGVRATRRLQNTFNVPADVQQTMLLDVARTARHVGQLNMAVRYLAVLNNSPELSVQTRSGLWLEDARLNWLLGDRQLARRLIQQSLGNTDIESSLSRACALRILGEFLADTQSADTRSLIDAYFINSLKLLATIEQQREALAGRMRKSTADIGAFVLANRRRAYESIGKYADQEYHRIGGHMRSEQFQAKRQSVAQNQQRVEEMGAAKHATREMKCMRTVLHRNTDIDRKELAATEAELDEYLQLAVKYYVLACTMQSSAVTTGAEDGGTGGSVIFRLISLWLANQSNAAIVGELKRKFAIIASWQFMAVLPQIAARCTNVAGDFGETVMGVMERCAIDHPQQAIYQILALANAYADDPAANSMAVKPPRVLGAIQLVERLKRNEKTLLAVSQMSEMCKALIAFANKENTDTSRIASKEPIRKLLNLNYVHCPTLTLSISKSAKYPDLITVHKWSEVLTMVGGINAPKKVDCLCSNGRTYPQLIKGKDDLRQDAIMQQVFTILNEMLATNRDTQKARLTVKTYRVVPMTQRFGILEWCANTLPLAVYLAGTSKQAGAHERFHPDDLKATYCRRVVSTYNRDQKPNAEKCKIFKQMCEQFRPALQYFFLERFARPGEWFERRLAYTKSVATTSMIGYILGIGDRHVSNILIDEKTAELVHIDFGIAFEQSKCLPTPEMIPFRLTRDMVAAMGVSGVDGIFRRSCERTMEVLRHNKRTITTILEVLLYDPLYAWALTAKQAYSRQSTAGDGGGGSDGQSAGRPSQRRSSEADDAAVAGEQKNVMAERALLRLEAKLDGKEEGTASGATATVEAHVELLISQATSMYNLCRLFEGWQAYL